MTNAAVEKLSHDNLNATVSFEGTTLAAKVRAGWIVLSGHPEEITKAARRALWALPDNAPAEEVRRITAMNLDDEE